MNQTIRSRIEQIKRGAIPDGYKKTKVGIVPKEWTEHTLSEFFDFKNGLNKEKEAFGKGTPIVNYTDVWGKRGLLKENIKGKVLLSKNEIDLYKVEEGDVFFTRTSETIEEIGLSSVLLEPINDCVFSGFVLRARPKKAGIVKEYNIYCYSSAIMRHEITRKSSMTTRALTNGTLLGEVNINLPNQKEQEKIAEILQEQDRLIDLKEKLIEEKKKQKQYLMEVLLTGKVRLPGFTDKWRKVRLKTILKERNDYAVKDGEYPHVTLSTEGIYLKNERYNRDFLVKTEEKEYKITHSGDICYNPANLKFGVICVNDFGDAIFSPIYVTFEVAKTEDFHYIGNYMCRNNFINAVRKYEEGTVYERMSVKPQDMLLFTISLPTLPEQKAISNVLSKADDELALLQTELEEQKRKKQSLMQLLLTGIVRV